MESWITTSWESIARLGFMTLCAYVGLILMLRVSVTRTLSQLNAFDFIGTVALGSILATVILDRSIPLTEGLAAFAFLILVQFVLISLSSKFRTVRQVIKSEPVLLVYNGTFIQKSLRRQRISEDELLQVLRSNGINKIEKAQAVVLETNGNYSVLESSAADKGSTVKNVRGIDGDYS